ncbi:branched-chain amino acid ABC transporter permease [Actinomadura sp. 1N219]|uniref:branched-chain amino acid ABC transporter permease n=1 Tax=Actinomadura sp. 1N219 TaxID=3375152 RepID=UPI0037923D66
MRSWNVRSWNVPRPLLIACAAVLVAAPASDGSGFLVSVATLTAINAVFALSLTLVYGMGGMISLAQVGFGAVAAYLVVLGTQKEGYPFVPVLLVALAAVVVLALVLGLPVTRLSGIYFLTATFAFTEVLRLVAVNWTPVTGGQIGTVIEYEGLTRLPGAAAFGTFLSPDLADYMAALVLLALTVWVVWSYRQSRSGRNLMSLRDNERLATALGVRAVPERLMAFAVSAVIAALGGVFLAYYNGIADSTSMNVTQSIDLLIIVIVGGVQSIRGAVVGAVVVTVVPELLQLSVDLRPILYGLLLIAFATRLRLGIVGELQRLWRARSSAGPRTPLAEGAPS